MKIVIFGPERRLGALAGDCVIDLNRGFARYLQERGDGNANEHAAERLPPDLKSFIEGGPLALENAQQVIDHFDGIGCDDGGELLNRRFWSSETGNSSGFGREFSNPEIYPPSAFNPWYQICADTLSRLFCVEIRTSRALEFAKVNRVSVVTFQLDPSRA